MHLGGSSCAILRAGRKWFAFSLINAFMEEIWFRGLFLRRLEPALGAAGALLLTTLAFGTSHLFATYVDLWGT